MRKQTSETFNELLSSLRDSSPMGKLVISQISAKVLEKEDESLLMDAYCKTPAYLFHEELMFYVEEQSWHREFLSFTETEIVLEHFLRGYKGAHEDKEEISA